MNVYIICVINEDCIKYKGFFWDKVSAFRELKEKYFFENASVFQMCYQLSYSKEYVLEELDGGEEE